MDTGIADAARTTVPGAAHFTSEHEPAAFNRVVLAFLTGRNRGAERRDRVARNARAQRIGCGSRVPRRGGTA